jgi:sulfoxide reductase heme-binding subunit YedZ
MALTDQLNSVARRIPSAPLYVLAALPGIWFFYQGLTGGLGAEPIKALEHKLGELALQFLIAGLTITPLRRLLGVNLLKFRRMLGLVAFCYVLTHLLVWLLLDVQLLSQIWADILKRPYITVGMVGFVVLVPLALTSNNWSIRRLGAKWRALHRLAYVAAVLGAVHFVMLVKGVQIEPLLYLVGVLALLSLRIRRSRRKVAV